MKELLKRMTIAAALLIMSAGLMSFGQNGAASQNSAAGRAA